MTWLERVFKRRQLERELVRELHDHLERQRAEFRQAGFTEAEARRQALLSIGGVQQTLEECRDARGTSWIESTVQDFRIALRTLRKSPGFAITAIATFALGIGANAAIFALLDAVRLRSLPVGDPQKLAVIQVEGGNKFGRSRLSNTLSHPVFRETAQNQRGFSAVFGWEPDTFSIGEGANRRHADGYWVTSGFFDALGVPPQQGHYFAVQDDRPGCGFPGVVISNGFWQSEFGGRDSAIGSKLLIEGKPTEIVGVAPGSFSGPEVGRAFSVALPLCALPAYSPDSDDLVRSDYAFLTVMGRLRTGWTLAQAKDQLASISAGIFRATLPSGYDPSSYRGYLDARLTAYPSANGVSGLRDNYDTALWLLLGMTGLVLLIACTNLANLMLVRATTRERELAVRLAMGASRWRLIRQVLTEGFVLAAMGGTFGILLARAFSRSIVFFLTTERDSIYLDLHLDWRVLGFTAAVTISTFLISALIPALRASQTNPAEAIKSGGRSMTRTRARGLFQNSLIVSEVAISLVLLIGAVLFVRSFRNLMTMDPGFRERNIILAALDFSHLPPMPEGPAALYLKNALEQLRAIPQVQSAGTASHVPLDGSSWTLGFNLAGERGSSKFTWVSHGYFETMGKPVLEGRALTDRDWPASPHVVVVNQTFVKRYLHGSNPIGRTLRTLEEPNYPPIEYQIIGVVKDAKYAGLREQIPPEAFASALERGANAYPNVFIRSSSPPSIVIAAVRQKLSQISPEIRSDFRVLETEIQDGLVRERLMAILSSFFGAVAALLSAVGLYGVISYVVAARRSEIGIRLALGARRSNIVRTVLAQALTLVFGGIIIGLMLAWAGVATAGSLLYGLESHDLPTFLLSSAFLFAVALAAAFLPAQRASRVDPMDALHCE